jgi:hypothetical protein
MALVAVTDINDGNTVTPAGSVVKKSDFDSEVLEHLQEIGSVAEVGPAQQEDDRDAQIAELQAKLAELTGGAKPDQGLQTPLSDAEGTKEPSKAEAAKATGQASGGSKNSPADKK